LISSSPRLGEDGVVVSPRMLEPMLRLYDAQLGLKCFVDFFRAQNTAVKSMMRAQKNVIGVLVARKKAHPMFRMYVVHKLLFACGFAQEIKRKRKKNQ
jgi:hypothetical protein